MESKLIRFIAWFPLQIFLKKYIYYDSTGTVQVYLFTLYCRLIDGFEVLDELEKLSVNPKTYKPLSDIRINRVTIHANPLAGWK